MLSTGVHLNFKLLYCTNLNTIVIYLSSFNYFIVCIKYTQKTRVQSEVPLKPQPLAAPIITDLYPLGIFFCLIYMTYLKTYFCWLAPSCHINGYALLKI